MIENFLRKVIIASEFRFQEPANGTRLLNGGHVKKKNRKMPEENKMSTTLKKLVARGQGNFQCVYRQFRDGGILCNQK